MLSTSNKTALTAVEHFPSFSDIELCAHWTICPDLHENTAAGQSYIAALEEASVEELGYFLKPPKTYSLENYHDY